MSGLVDAGGQRLDLQPPAQLVEVGHVEVELRVLAAGFVASRVKSAWAMSPNGRVNTECTWRGVWRSLNSLMTCLVTGSGAIGTGYGLSEKMRVGMPSLSYTTRPGVTVMVSSGSGGPSIGRGMFQTGSHEICGSVAARTCRAVVTTSMFMICSGIPLLRGRGAEQRGPAVDRSVDDRRDRRDRPRWPGQA